MKTNGAQILPHFLNGDSVDQKSHQVSFMKSIKTWPDMRNQ